MPTEPVGDAYRDADSGRRNTEGTPSYQDRVHRFTIILTPKEPSGPTLQITYQDTIFFTWSEGTLTGGLNPDVLGSMTYRGFPIPPVATFTGDGFGGPGSGGKRIPVDSEGLTLASDGGFWVSDGYGPYVYHFSANGRNTKAKMPPAAYIPHCNGSISFNEFITDSQNQRDDHTSQHCDGKRVQPRA